MEADDRISQCSRLSANPLSPVGICLLTLLKLFLTNNLQQNDDNEASRSGSSETQWRFHCVMGSVFPR